ncbi:MAG TPA: MarC family protein [Prolixibacteraceae bacterium]|nr:MarC family protein [Prolixibacteraceae bacterium]
MSDSISFALLCFTSFFTLLNPLGVMPVFMTMTKDFEVVYRRRTALKATIVSFFTIMSFALTGQLLFRFFGISVDSLRIVGGVIFFIMGQDMLQARLGNTKITASEMEKHITDISITPLAIPMICGLGAITNAIVLMQDAVNAEMKLILIITIFVICVITYLVLIAASPIMKVLGETGNKIMLRLMGLIVMVIGVEFFFAGLKPFVKEMMK